ncbi:hypothetical protein [Amycolatopsis alkalitolerans]|uniref:Lipoprotein n=1 Tax=Amycolatopsis alkalitolerans TaxID=2547244 RepID=A0A5C4M222_9PSEU|nr:hypothetical protein [Amycolatopsis alkalitolerans]TNC26885.1 hypothetical protein FG385_10615 [Amycolatopsis alkalitolerans]
MRDVIRCAVSVTAAVAVLGACAAPPGEPAAVPPPTSAIGAIPANQPYVTVQTADGAASVDVPEGWLRTAGGSSLLFTSGFDSVAVDTSATTRAPSVDSVTAEVVPVLRTTNDRFVLGSVTAAGTGAGPAIRVTYQAQATSAPSPVLLGVERYEFWRAGHQVTLTLSSPLGADNEAAWRRIVESLRWR